MSKTHIRNERATRDALRAEGRDDLAGAERLPAHGSSWSWCGEYVHCGLLDVDHAAISLRYCGGTAPCKKCLREIMKVFERELEGKS